MIFENSKSKGYMRYASFFVGFDDAMVLVDYLNSINGFTDDLTYSLVAWKTI